MKYMQNKSNKMAMWFVILVMVVAIDFTVSVPLSWAISRDEIPFTRADIFFELNNTDGDLGIHALIDGAPWKSLEIEDPKENRLLKIRVNSRLRRQGLTEIFFESAEPPFDELSPEQFFNRFPAGTYRFEGITIDGNEIDSKTELSHVMPAPPEPTVNGRPMTNNCESEATVVTHLPVTIKWPKVTMSHPAKKGGGAAIQPPIPVFIHNYEIIIEVIVGEEGNAFSSVMNAILPPNVTSFTVPKEFISLGDKFKYEVIAREESFNQTAIESCFTLKLE